MFLHNLGGSDVFPYNTNAVWGTVAHSMLLGSVPDSGYYSERPTWHEPGYFQVVSLDVSAHFFKSNREDIHQIPSLQQCDLEIGLSACRFVEIIIVYMRNSTDAFSTKMNRYEDF